MSSGKLTDDATTGPEDQGRDLYRFDLATKELIDLSPDTGAANGAEVQGVLGMSDDGSYVYFVANGKLAPGSSTGNCHGTTGRCNLYVWHDGVTKFIAPTLNGSPDASSDSGNWLPKSHQEARLFEKTSRVDSSGNVLLFRSFLKLTGYENAGHAELYRYDAASGSLGCISCNPTGLPPAGNAGLQSLPEALVAPRGQAPTLTRNLSTNGNRIVFDSPDRLVPGDENNVNDVYEWEAPQTGSCTSSGAAGGCLLLVSSGKASVGGVDPASYFADASETGDDIFFFTKQQLVAQDGDQLQDVYDARVNGGIPAQNTVPPAPCEEELCLPGVPPAPTAPTPNSAGNVSGGNVKPVKPCKKGQKRVKRKGKSVCVKKPALHKKKAHHKKKGGHHHKSHRGNGGSR